MKKLGKIAMIGAVAAIAVAGTVGLTACGGGSSADYEGEYKYSVSYDGGVTSSNYGVKVTVTISNVTSNIKQSVAGQELTYKGFVTDGKITKVTVEEIDGYHNITETWQASADGKQLGYEATKAGLNDYLKKFNGAKISEIGEIIMATDDAKAENGVPATGAASGQGDYIYTGATQTSGRILIAMKEAITDWQLAAAKTSMKAVYKATGVSGDMADAAIEALGDDGVLAAYVAILFTQQG